jgi:hypothetical protein
MGGELIQLFQNEISAHDQQGYLLPILNNQCGGRQLNRHSKQSYVHVIGREQFGDNRGTASLAKPLDEKWTGDCASHTAGSRNYPK